MTILRCKRKNAGLTVDELAHQAGLTVMRVYRLEQGQPLRLSEAVALASVLKCTAEELEPHGVTEGVAHD